jgi:uncharacterized protein (TIGR02145 family)
MKKVKIIFIILIGISHYLFAQTVKIGNQVWMAKNLNVDKFRNGDPIMEAKTELEWKNVETNNQPAFCYYNNDPSNEAKYGKLYNWYAVNDPRGLAPAGWHIPSAQEWTELIDFLGGTESAGKKMKSASGWLSKPLLGTNESGFNGLPGGYRFMDGEFSGIENSCYWWSATEYMAKTIGDDLADGINGHAWSRQLIDYNNVINSNKSNEGDGLSVRCLKD